MNITREWLDSQPEYSSNNREIRYDCPNCADMGKHMYVSANKSVWYCFKCGVGGKVLDTKDNIPNLLTFEPKREAHFILENKVNPELSIKAPIKSLPLSISLPHIEIAEDCETSEELNARNYLHRRGITQDEITRYDIRLSLERTGPYKNSIIFPVRSQHMKTIDYFVCRKYNSSEPKYINAPWSKNDTLFLAGYTTLVSTAVIVEGIFDALAVARAGFVGIALLGKKVTAQQLPRLLYMYKKYLIYLDRDAFTHAIQLKLQLNTLNVGATLINYEKDAADLYISNADELRRLLRNG